MSKSSYPDMNRAYSDIHKDMRKIEKEFNKPLFNVENARSEEVKIKTDADSFFEMSSNAITSEIAKVNANIKAFKLESHKYYPTNTKTALIVSALEDQSLKRSGYCADLSLYDEIRVVAKNAKCIYFIQCELTGLVKIGLASNVHKRLSGLQTGSPTKLKLVGSIVFDASLEKLLHKHFEDDHSHGEWFKPNPQLSKIINTLSNEDALFFILNCIGFDFKVAN